MLPLKKEVEDNDESVPIFKGYEFADGEIEALYVLIKVPFS